MTVKKNKLGTINSDKVSTDINEQADTVSSVYGSQTEKNSDSRWSFNNIKKNLLAHYTRAPTDQLFKLFKLGAMLFFLGLVIIYSSYQLLQPSIAQEILTLLGLCCIGGGFLLAMLTQIRMLIGRLIHILFHKH